jgi:phosphoserine phosphatase
MFWAKRKGKIKRWYLDMKRSDDVITTASPSCLVRPIMDELGVRWIAAEVDVNTGKVIGLGNRDSAKPINFNHSFPNATIDKFFSDSVSADTPMAVLAKEAFLVRGDKILPWPR